MRAAPHPAATETRRLYTRLRRLAFAHTAETLKIEVLATDFAVVGAIMEQNFGDFTMLVIGLATGDASVYTDVGPGFIGGLRHENVRRAADEFIEATRKHIRLFALGDETPPPASGEARFYAITSKGRMTCSTSTQRYRESPLYPILETAHLIHLEFRRTPEPSD